MCRGLSHGFGVVRLFRLTTCLQGDQHLLFVHKLLSCVSLCGESNSHFISLFISTPLQDTHMPATQDVGSSVLVTTLAATLATGSWVNSLHGYQLPHWTTCDFTTLSMTSFRVERSPSCLVCNQAPRLQCTLYADCVYV